MQISKGSEMAIDAAVSCKFNIPSCYIPRKANLFLKEDLYAATSCFGGELPKINMGTCLGHYTVLLINDLCTKMPPPIICLYVHSFIV